MEKHSSSILSWPGFLWLVFSTYCYNYECIGCRIALFEATSCRSACCFDRLFPWIEKGNCAGVSLPLAFTLQIKMTSKGWFSHSPHRNHCAASPYRYHRQNTFAPVAEQEISPERTNVMQFLVRIWPFFFLFMPNLFCMAIVFFPCSLPVFKKISFSFFTGKSCFKIFQIEWGPWMCFQIQTRPWVKQSAWFCVLAHQIPPGGFGNRWVHCFFHLSEVR